jgi:hypothetical protein
LCNGDEFDQFEFRAEDGQDDNGVTGLTTARLSYAYTSPFFNGGN